MFKNGISRWENKVALVTGASGGIGAAISKLLVENGVIVVGCARNPAPIQEAGENYKNENMKGKLVAHEANISNEADVQQMFQWIKSTYGGVDICINCAGGGTMTSLKDITAAEMADMMNTNVIGLTLCSKFSWMSMLETGVQEGHIININSMAGHVNTGQMNFYSATKFAVTSLTEGLRKEICNSGHSGIRVSSISPGLVQTDFLEKATGSTELSKQIYAMYDAIQPEDVAETVLYVLSAPLRLEIYDITMRPYGELKYVR